MLLREGCGTLLIPVRIDGASLSGVVEDGLLFLIQPGPVKLLGPISMQVGWFVKVGPVVC